MALLTRSAARTCSLAGVLLALCTAVAGQLRPSPEYQLKAVFLFNFTQFVEWPRHAFRDPQAPLVIGVIGEDPFGSYLDEIVAGETIDGHPLVVRRFETIWDIEECHVLYIPRTEAVRQRQILAAVRGRPVLTVSDMEEFALNGGMIRLFTDRNRLRLRINVEAAKSAELIVSSKLLRSAEIVSSRGD